jgi:M6 family metalloprotease-like protein
MALSNLSRVVANRVDSLFPTRWRKHLTLRRLEALLLIAISVSYTAAGAGLAVGGLAEKLHPGMGTYDFVPPMPQFSSESQDLNYTIPFPVPRPSPVLGEIRVLVIAVEFSDYNHTISTEQVSNKTINQLNMYYSHISYGAISISGTVVGWIRLPYKMSQYGTDNGPFIDDLDGDGYPDSWRLLKDAAPIITSQVNFADYQEIVVLHAGIGEESSRAAGDIWSVTFVGMPVSIPQGTINRVAIVPESEDRGLGTLGVYAHEFGHLLGLPDLYSTNLEEVGPWDLMARGAWNGNPPGSSPAEMLAWDRIFLGWITPQHMVTVAKQSRMNVTLDPIESVSSGVQAVKAQTSIQNSKQYYLVEVRQKIGYDQAIPSSGVLITYVDEAKSNPVKVMDAAQTTSTLADAPFQVGQKYTDGTNNLVISIVSTNNSSYSIIVDTLGPTVDVAIEGLTLNPPTVHPNVTASLDIEVGNEGTLKAKPFFVTTYLNDTLFASRQISLGPGETQSIQLSWTPENGGTYLFKVVLDREKTLGENNTDNNAKTLRVVVGYTLTLEIRPPGGGGDIQWWIIVNGNNETYAGVGDFVVGVLPGTNTLQIEPTIYLNPSSRFVFRGWSDGSIENPRTIEVSSDTSLGADFDLQFLLSLQPNGGAISGAGWYNSGTSVTVTATSPSILVADQTRLVFLNWSGDLQSDSTSLVVNMTAPHSLQANWKTQYFLSIQSPYAAAGGGWYEANSQAVVSLASPVVAGNGVRYVFVEWSGDLSGTKRSQSLTMSGPKLVSAVWATQYELKVESEYGHVNGAGWYDPSAQATFGVDTLSIDTANDTRRVFTQWSGDAAGSSQHGAVMMDGPKTVQANWKTEYLVVFVTTGVRNGTLLTIVLNSESHQVQAPETIELWLDAGSSVSFSSNATAGESYRRYVFQEWRNSTGGAVESPQSVLKPERYVAVYKELSAFPCIIATVTFGSEATPEVQFLRAFRDHLVLSTHAGSAFMNAFNLWYYSFSPQVADFIVVHDAVRSPLRAALYPLLGVLDLSSATYSVFRSFPELGITIAGIVASALIGLVYLTPVTLLLIRLSRRRRVGTVRVVRALSISLLVAVAMLLLGELAGSLGLLAVAASVLVLTTLLWAPVLFSFELVSLERRLGLGARVRTALRI